MSLVPGYPFQQTDAGRSQSRRPKQTNDCTVRALALARGLAYDEACDLLKAAGRGCSNKFHLGDWLKGQPWAQKTSFQAIKGQRRMNPVRFCAEHPKGTFICKTAKHVFVVIDGVVLDNTIVPDARCIYTAWAVTPPS